MRPICNEREVRVDACSCLGANSTADGDKTRAKPLPTFKTSGPLARTRSQAIRSPSPPDQSPNNETKPAPTQSTPRSNHCHAATHCANQSQVPSLHLAPLHPDPKQHMTRATYCEEDAL
mmetsp:Transcript_102510/g.177011  ORF Transcript_102510/g.177011 Transcript_102510/m.177011 type:complete len:119 (+) Transcript_102510:2433-2789(+)